MANFLGNLGAALRGQQEYQTYLDQQQSNKLKMEAEKLRLQEISELTELARTQRARQPTIDQTFLDYLTQGQQGIPPPPSEPPPVQAPLPGEQSQPMIDPGQQPVQYAAQERPIGPPQGLPPEMQGIPQGMPPPPPQATMGPPQGMPQGQPMPPPGLPPIPPYQTVGGAGGPPPQMAMQGIPPPPPQQIPEPAPNSMSLQDAARFIKALGITDPQAAVQILEKLNPYLETQAKREAGILKMQLDQQNKEAALQEKIREADMRSADRNLSIQQQREWRKESVDARLELGKMMAGIAQQNANSRSAQAGTGGAGTGKGAAPTGPIDRQDAVEVQAWKFLTKGESPPARSPDYRPIMDRVALIAKENGMSPQEIISASADVKSKLAAKKNFEVRAQNMERAENQILAEVPLIRDAIKNIDLSKYPKFAKAQIWGLRELGDPRITALDQAVETVFNEFEGIRTGNLAALNVQDVQNARHNYENAKTPQQMEAAIQGIERTIANAKKGMATTRKHILDDINASFKKDGSGSNAKAAPSTAAPAGAGLKLPSTKADLKAGQIYQTARGPAKWNGTAFEAQ